MSRKAMPGSQGGSSQILPPVGGRGRGTGGSGTEDARIGSGGDARGDPDLSFTRPRGATGGKNMGQDGVMVRDPEFFVPMGP